MTGGGGSMPGPPAMNQKAGGEASEGARGETAAAAASPLSSSRQRQQEGRTIVSPSFPSPLETVLTAIAYASAVVATLRAGSRAAYLLRHGGRMGTVDGPLILGPQDVLDRRRRLVIAGQGASVVGNETGDGGRGPSEDERGGDGEEQLEVSPLWEPTYGFSQAIRLALDGCADHRIGESSSDDRWTEAVTCAFTDKGNAGGKERGILARLTAGKEEGEPYSLSPFGRRGDKAAAGQLVVAADHSRWTLDFDWHRGTASWGAVDADGKRSKGRLDEKPLGNGGRKGGKLDFNLRASSVVDIPVADALNSSSSSDGAPNAPRVAHISAYAPTAFANLRKQFGVKESDYRREMLHSGPYVSFQSNSKGAARVGGFFFFTRDGAYMVKTVKNDEVGTFLNMLPKYYQYMRRNSKRSLLTRFCGMYSVRVADATSVDGGEDEHVFIVMNSVFPAEASKFISERFDLKGSTVGRECSLKEREERGSNAVLKDLDLAKEVSLARAQQSMSDIPSYGINIGDRAKAVLLTQLRRDVALLVECEVMDYSLLVGVLKEGRSVVGPPTSPTSPGDVRLHSGYVESKREKMAQSVVSLAAECLRHLPRAPVYAGKKICFILEKGLSRVLPNSLPYYGAGMCGVDGGSLSIIRGRRSGRRAVYYMGMIDFLQPWTAKKVMERELKGLIGYDTKAISCVHPKDYASRFLDFIDAHVT